MKSWVFNRIAYFIICHAFISLSSDQAAFAGLVEGRQIAFCPTVFSI